MGYKRIETRSWSTRYRGLLAIHAARLFPVRARELCLVEPFRSALGYPGEELPIGAILAICQLVDCVLITPDNLPTEPELSFGDYTPGRWAWRLQEIRPLPMPVPAKGQLALWEWVNG
jgi:hypothetical protein